MIVVIDGPNKSGKSLLIEELVVQLDKLEYSPKVRHWGPLKTDDREYTDALIEDSVYNGVVIWDRSWVCEHVYGTMLDRKRRLVTNPWLGEFLHTRGVRQKGLCFIVMPARAGLNIDLLDKTDAKYSDNPYWERELFFNYADRFKWHKLFNRFERPAINEMVNLIEDEIVYFDVNRYKSNTAFVIDSDEEYMPGGWLPGSSVEYAKYAQMFSYGALISTWMHKSEVSNYDMEKFDMIVSPSETIANAFKKVSKLKSKIHYVKSIEVINDDESYDQSIEFTKAFNAVNDKLEKDWNATKHILYV